MIWFALLCEKRHVLRRVCSAHGMQVLYKHYHEPDKTDNSKQAEAIIKNQKVIDETESDEEAAAHHMKQYAPGGGTWSKSGWAQQQGGKP